jgi:hypothetical protein
LTFLVCAPGPTARLCPPHAPLCVCELGPTRELGYCGAPGLLSHGSRDTPGSAVARELGRMMHDKGTGRMMHDKGATSLSWLRAVTTSFLSSTISGYVVGSHLRRCTIAPTCDLDAAFPPFADGNLVRAATVGRAEAELLAPRSASTPSTPRPSPPTMREGRRALRPRPGLLRWPRPALLTPAVVSQPPVLAFEESPSPPSASPGAASTPPHALLVSAAP